MAVPFPGAQKSGFRGRRSGFCFAHRVCGMPICPQSPSLDIQPGALG